MRLRLALALAAAPAGLLLFGHPTPAHAQLARDCGDYEDQLDRLRVSGNVNELQNLLRAVNRQGGCDGLNNIVAAEVSKAATTVRPENTTRPPPGNTPVSTGPTTRPPPPPPRPTPEPSTGAVSMETGGEPDILGIPSRYNLNITNTDRITGEGGVYYDEFLRPMNAGDSIEITATSQTVPLIVAIGTGHLPDSYIIESINQVDGPDDHTASVRFVAPSDDEYVIVVASADNTIAGPYTVSLQSWTPPPPPDPVPTAIGRTVTGALSEHSARLYTDGDVPYDIWTFQGEAGQAVQIDMTTDNGDPYLSLGREVDGRFEEITFNDDTDGLNSQIVQVLPNTGEYVIRARSFSALPADQTLHYRLSIEPIVIALPDPMPISIGGTVTSSLTDASERLTNEGGVPYEPWTFTGRAGQRIRIDMRSTEIDPYLILGRMENGQFVEIARNDDSDGLNSMIRRVLDADGEYLIRARAFSSSASGAYDLSISELAGNPATPIAVSGDANSWVIDGALAEDSAIDGDSQGFYQDYRFTAQRNRTYTVRVESGPNGWWTPIVDLRRAGRGGDTTGVDVYNMDTSSRAQNELPPISERGDYIIRVRSADQGSTGPFRVIITEGRQ